MGITTGGQPPFSNVFVFGDSLSDNGAVSAFTAGAVPPAVLNGVDGEGGAVDLAALGIFYNGQFTNGDVYADISLARLGIASDTSTFYDDFSGSNFAVGGATATDLSLFGGGATNTLADQVDAFKGAVAALPSESRDAVLATSAASIFIGLNDLSALGAASTVSGEIDFALIEQGVAFVVGEIVAQTQELVDQGVGTIILNTLPGGSFFPASNPLIDAFGPGTAELFDQVSVSVNDGIKNLAASLEGQVAVEVVDFFSLAAEIQADQETFGFLTLENALPGGGGSADVTLLIEDVPIDQIGFLDTVHFTEELHEVFAVFQAETLFNEQIDGGSARAEILVGGSGDQTIFGNGGRDLIRAGTGDDLAFGGEGRDGLSGDSGEDILFGGLDRDRVSGGRDDDVLSGGAGADNVKGGSGDDVVVGNEGNDRLIGSSGDDLLVDGLGSDRASGGSGDDFFLHRAAELLGGEPGQDRDTFKGGRGIDTLLIVSDTEVDISDYLAANNIRTRSIEEVLVITEAELETFFESTALAEQAETADLFGLV